MYPLRFEPIYQYRLWGGRRLEQLESAPLPSGPVGEAWILSDRDDFPSRVAEGPLAGQTVAELIRDHPRELLGRFEDRYRRFPLLLKFLDAREMLSVQVHPTDEQREYLPQGEMGKTEAWVVLQADADSRIYAGLRPGTTADDLRALNARSADEFLAYFHPSIGDGVFLPAGTVHALGGGVVVFEVQQNSDVTFRLYDWDRVDPTTGKARQLHVEEAIACTNFDQGIIGPVWPTVDATAPVLVERLFQSEHFWLARFQGSSPFPVGVNDAPRIIVCVEGSGELETGAPDAALRYPIRTGDVYMLPPAINGAEFHPSGETVMLEIGLPGDTLTSLTA
jgi:mannose-6-phosphate isomerase